MSREEESAFYEHFPTLNARLIVNRVPYKGLEHLVRMGAHGCVVCIAGARTRSSLLVETVAGFQVQNRYDRLCADRSVSVSVCVVVLI